LVPWVKQWHNQPNDEFGGLRLGDYFDTFLDAQCRELRAWRPEAKKRGKAGGRTRAEECRGWWTFSYAKLALWGRVALG
jgi:hypothetical protein